MSIIRETPIRKTVFKSNRTVNLNDFKTLIVNKDFYSTLGEDLIIVRDVTQSKIKLDSTTTERIKIKTLTNCIIIPDIGRIDEDWDEISIGRGACVELQNINGVWYVLSSDGVKMD
jgi:hypothetical protein